MAGNEAGETGVLGSCQGMGRVTEEPLCCRARPARQSQRGLCSEAAWRGFVPKLGIKPAPTHQARSLENISLFGFAEIQAGYKVFTCRL